ncbi:MAG: bifunctional UDP-N-acetylglucosamine diphosphorylase/glucosamine-1-phosphate N-acetyltransferase GlmU [Thermodesulfobacteriota bacterium]
MKNVAALILAAGKGKRMQSSLPKVMHPVAGKPMLFYPVRLSKDIGANKIVVIVGHRKEEVTAAFKDSGVEFAEQDSPLGTGHAILSAEDRFKDWTGEVIILSGDVPLVTEETLKRFLKSHREGGYALSLLSTVVEDPTGYGRVVRGSNKGVVKVIEENEASSNEKKIKEINAGIYCISSSLLFELVNKVEVSPTGEYYLTDIIKDAIDKGLKVSAIRVNDPLEVKGVNNRIELSTVNRVMRKRIIEKIMLSGVTIVDPENTYIDYGVKVAIDTTIYPDVFLQGNTVIGEGCIIEEGCKIVNTNIGRGSTIKSRTLIEDARLGVEVTIGPFARLRPGNIIGDRVRIGNFVEVKNSRIGHGTKANHLSYLGDAIIGEGVNIGAGTITCNYDGFKKYKTIIEDRAFIGSDSQLIAPVRVGEGAYIGSGSTISKDVPPGALAISRVKQRNIEGWVEKRMKESKE